MNLYRFEKWYFDILTENKDYIIMFFSLFELMGFRLGFFAFDKGSFESKDADFKTFSTKLKILKRKGATFLTDKGVISIGKDASSIDLTFNEMSIKIDIASKSTLTHDIPGLYIKQNKWQYLNWKPLFLKYHVTGKIIINNKDLLVHERKGYADYLTSMIRPLKVPVKTLFWGRLHGEGFDLTYSYAEGKRKDASWGAMIYHADNQSQQLNILYLKPVDFKYLEETGISCPSAYHIQAGNSSLAISLEVRHIKPAIVSAFSDIPNTPGRVGKSLTKKLLRNPRGGKFFSSARIEIMESGNKKLVDQLFMIDEYVKFMENEN